MRAAATYARHGIRFTRGRGPPCPVFISSREEMERREAPGCLRGTHRRTFARGSSASRVETDCESVLRGARVLHRWGCEAHRADAAPPGAPPAAPRR